MGFDMSQVIETDLKDLLIKIDNKIDNLSIKVDNGFRELNDRVTKLETSVAELKDAITSAGIKSKRSVGI
jgi:monomeric isocitrate dehydrogenase